MILFHSLYLLVLNLIQNVSFLSQSYIGHVYIYIHVYHMYVGVVCYLHLYLCVVCKSLLASFVLPYASLINMCKCVCHNIILYSLSLPPSLSLSLSNFFPLSSSLSLSLPLPLPPPSPSLFLPPSLFLSLISPLLLLVCLFLV